MADQAPSTTAPNATPGPKDFAAKAEAALDDLHSGKLEGLELEETDEGLELPDDIDQGEQEEITDEPVDIEGSQGQPFTVKTLPDQYVTIKVDGQEKTLPLREMVDGYMRESAFHKRVGEVTELKRQVETMVERTKEESKKIRSNFQELINNPEDLYDLLDNHAAETLDMVARMRLKRMMEWQKNPQAKHEHERQKHEAKLRAKEEKLNREREEWTRNRTETEQQEKHRKAFEPGWQAGMKEAGYPKVTQDFAVTVRGILNAIRETQGRSWTAEDVKAAVIRAARITKAETVAERKPIPAKAPLPGQKRPTASKVAPSAPKSFRDVFKNLGK